AGRGAELERLVGLLGLATAARPQVAFVTGEPGIGKTTLVETFAGWAEGGGRAVVARGQCLEHRGAPEPYLPVFDALGRLGRQDGGGVEGVGGGGRAAGPGCPALAGPDAGAAGGRGPGGGGAAGPWQHPRADAARGRRG